MSVTWLEQLLPQALVSSRMRLWWVAFFALFPLAYGGGVMLEMAQERPARIAGSEDRAALVQKARQFAASKGFAAADWHQYAIQETRDNLLAYYQSKKASEVAVVSALAPAREVQVLLRSPDQKQDFRVYLSLSGDVTGYDYGKSVDRARNISSDLGIVHIQTDTSNDEQQRSGPEDNKTAGEQEAEAIARRSWAANPALSKLVRPGPAKVSADSGDASRYEVVWDTHPGSLNGLTLHLTTSVRGSQIVAQHIVAGVDKDHVVKKQILQIVLEGFYATFLTFSTFFAMYRYAKRTLQKEVSHLRTLVVAVLFAGSYSLFAYSLGVDQVAIRVSGATFQKISLVTYVISGIVLAAMGLLVGIGFGSGEGELREAYPGKLTSLDALLAGRIASRAVAASVLFGVAVAGWLLLVQSGIGYLLPGNVDASRNDALRYTFSRLPHATVVFGTLYDALVIAVAGLLLPAPFLLRRKARTSRRFSWLIVFAVLSVLGDTARNSTTPLMLLAIVVLASALLLPFFAFDLLAAMVSLSALAFVQKMVRLAEVIPPWSSFALFLAALTVVGLAVAVYLATHGAQVHEEEVRPLYAKNLAERMAMQAEIRAAREAQLRLLPQGAPELPGVQLAACCLPAHGVGGDFYDFFRLDAERVGIFVAQGGEEGLASALRIALAKGLLMHASQQSRSPRQIVLGLETSIAELLAGSQAAGISFAYAIMDARRNLLTYARIGTSPRLMIYHEGATTMASSHLERQVSEDRPAAHPIYEGVAQAHPGDLLIFATTGLLSARNRLFGRSNQSPAQILLHDLARPAEPLQSFLEAALAKFQNDASEDLTAVVLRIVARQVQMQVREVVA